MLPHPLTNFEIQKYYKNKPIFNGVYSRHNLSEIKDGAYGVRRYWNSLHCFVHTKHNVIYVDSFGVEHIPKEIKAFIKVKT